MLSISEFVLFFKPRRLFAIFFFLSQDLRICCVSVEDLSIVEFTTQVVHQMRKNREKAIQILILHILEFRTSYKLGIILICMKRHFLRLFCSSRESSDFQMNKNLFPRMNFHSSLNIFGTHAFSVFTSTSWLRAFVRLVLFIIIGDIY